MFESGKVRERSLCDHFLGFIFSPLPQVVMSGQKSLHFLRSTKYWSLVQQFLDDPSQETLSLPRSVTSGDRDQIRQICKHFDVPFKVHGEGSEKFMVLRKPDYSYFDEAEKLVSDQFASAADVEKFKQLAIKLSRELCNERIKFDIFLHQSIENEHKRESTKADVEYKASTKLGYCPVCAERYVARLNEVCGHTTCRECWDITRCAFCDGPMGDYIELADNAEVKAEQRDNEENPSTKRHRS